MNIGKRYERADLQDLLAAKYVMGSLRGAGRRRLVSLMAQLPALSARVQWWEDRMYPLESMAPRVRAPRAAWRRIHERISPRVQRANRRRQWWAGFASASLVFALAAFFYVGVDPWRDTASTSVAVLHDAGARPSMLVSWTGAQRAKRQLRVRVFEHPGMPDGTSWQVWLLRVDQPPMALGLVTTEAEQVLVISPQAAQALDGAVSIGMSVEAKGGSSSGSPNTPYLFFAPVLHIDG